SFHVASIFNYYGIPAIKPIAVVQKKFGFIKLRSFFISQTMTGIMTGYVYFRNESKDRAEWDTYIGKVADLTRKLRRHRIYHGDYHLGNLVIKQGMITLLDYDDVKFCVSKHKFLKRHREDLTHFIKHLKGKPDAEQAFKGNPIYEEWMKIAQKG